MEIKKGLWLGLSNLLSVWALIWFPVMGIPWLVVGLQNQDLCNNGGAYYLVVMGGLALAIGFLSCCLFTNFTDKIFARFLFAPVFLAILITTIWGSVNVFGEFYNFLGRAERSEVSFKFLSSKS